METRTEICCFTIVVTGIAMLTGLPLHLHCHSIVSGWFSATGASHSRAVLCLQPPAQEALARHWAVTDRPIRRSGRLTGQLAFFNVVIVIYGHVVLSANVREETKLGKRRTYRGRRNMFLWSSLRFPNFFPNFSPRLFFKLFQTLWKKILWKKSLEKNGSAPSALV